MNDSTRQKKVARMLQKELSKILQKNKRNLVGNAFVTVTEVGISPDLAVAKVFLSLLMVDDKPGLIDQLNIRKKEIRGQLGHSIGKQMRIVPEIFFKLDDLQEKASKMDRLIDNLHIPPPSDEEEKEMDN